MKKLKTAGFLFTLLLTLCSCGANQQAAPEADASAAVTEQAAPEKHAIAADSSLDTLDDIYGADAFQNSLDHLDSEYYIIHDYYNMESGGGKHILTHYATYQQTTEYSCGCAAALMALNYYGISDYNEMEICQLAGTDETKGTSVEGMVSFFETAGLPVDFHADTGVRFETIEEFVSYVTDTIDSGAPILVDWVDWRGHWQTIIGIDSCGTENPYDDVLILADSYDVTDHYQDGYYIVPLGRFYDMWREGVCAGKEIPYEQPFVTVYRAEQ